MDSEKLQELIIEMSQFDENRNYYAFTFTGNESGQITIGAQTQWAGWSDDTWKHEIRVPRLVKPAGMAKLWNLLQQPYLVVNEDEHYFIFCILGGNALIDPDVLKRNDPELLSPDICTRSGALGFVSLQGLPKQAFNHAPTPKQRMRILKRDGFRCRICGRQPADYTDVELHIHHIRPFSAGGPTEDENLITLCHTCHKGLEPHNDSSVFYSISRNSVEVKSSNFLKSVIRYRTALWEAYSKLDKA